MTDKTLWNYFRVLPQSGRFLATYVWIDGTHQHMRQKTITVDASPKQITDLITWSFNGAATSQASGDNNDVLIKPVALFRDPFKGEDNFLVLTETLNHDGTQHSTNSRKELMNVMERAKSAEPHFGAEQMFTIMKGNGRPIGWPETGYPAPEGPYFCGVGTDRVFGRDIVQSFYKACVYAGVRVTGFNAEVVPGQWKFQVGPCNGVELGDHLWMARFILNQVAEEFGVLISMDSKPVPGEWSPASCQINFSTRSMRENGGMQYVIEACKKLALTHQDHMKAYYCTTDQMQELNLRGNQTSKQGYPSSQGNQGYQSGNQGYQSGNQGYQSGNQGYQSGNQSSSQYSQGGSNLGGSGVGNQGNLGGQIPKKPFSYGVGSRSEDVVRIPWQCNKEGKGYLEDMRPPANCDPYLVCAKLTETVCLGTTNY